MFEIDHSFVTYKHDNLVEKIYIPTLNNLDIVIFLKKIRSNILNNFEDKDAVWANVLLGPYIYNVMIDNVVEKQHAHVFALAKISPFSETKNNLSLECTKTTILVLRDKEHVIKKIEYDYPQQTKITKYIFSKLNATLQKKGPRSVEFILFHNILRLYLEK